MLEPADGGDCIRARRRWKMEPVDGVPLTSDRAEAPAADDAGHGTSGVYRPRYELVAEEILQLIGELFLRPGDRLPTEKELAARLGTSRTVVRDAVKILSATGRVSAQKGQIGRASCRERGR